MIYQELKEKIKGYFDLTTYLEDQDTAVQSIMDGVSFRGPNIIILILAIFIASLGLNTNSAAVIIGAMLISPLMGPIIGLGLGVGTYNYPLVKRALRNLLTAATFSVLTSTLYFLISPVSEGHSELLARTSPTIYDVFIAFFGGGAGIVAIACKQKGNVIPGVAIATALMPPLCTAGYGLATMQLHYFFGALYLFIINSIFIAYSTLIGVKMFNFKKYQFVDVKRQSKVKHWFYAIVVLTLLPSVYLTVQMLHQSFFINDANNFVDTEFAFPNTQVFSKKVYMKSWHKFIDVTLVGQRVDLDSLHQAAVTKMDEDNMLRGATLKITQGFSTSDIQASSVSNESMRDVFTTAINQIDKQKAQIDSLKSILATKAASDSMAYLVSPEIQVVFPSIQYIALDRSIVCNTETGRTDTLNIAIMEVNGNKLPDSEKVKRYLETRTGMKDIQIILTDFPKETILK